MSRRRPVTWPPGAVAYLATAWPAAVPVADIAGTLAAEQRRDILARPASRFPTSPAAEALGMEERRQPASLARQEAATGRSVGERWVRPIQRPEPAQCLVWAVPTPGREAVLRQRAENGRGRV